MENLIAGLAVQLREAIVIGDSVDQPLPNHSIQHVLLVGLGGSAFGGEIVRNYISSSANVSFEISRSYTVPNYLSANTLVIISSYSGNTEETLAAAEICKTTGAYIVCITSGGKLAAWAKTHGYTLYLLPAGYPPRAAAGFSIVQQLFILYKAGLIEDFLPDLEAGIRAIETVSESKKAELERIGQQLSDRAVVLYAGDCIDSIAVRARQQINENGKQLCWHHILPEMNHNELVGWQLPQFLIAKTTVVFLRSRFEHPRVSLRFEISKKIISRYTNEIIDLWTESSENQLAELLLWVYYVDWISVYLATANGVEATPVAVIDFLKDALAQNT
jgi:glucose/mannose-6-phosphate isomerase